MAAVCSDSLTWASEATSGSPSTSTTATCVGAVEQEHEVVLASFVRMLDAQHFTAIVLSRSLDAEFLQQHGQALGQTLPAETGTDVCGLAVAEVVDGDGGSAVETGPLICLEGGDHVSGIGHGVYTSAKSCATVPLSKSRWSMAPGKSFPIGANSSTRTPTTSRMEPG